LIRVALQELLPILPAILVRVVSHLVPPAITVRGRLANLVLQGIFSTIAPACKYVQMDITTIVVHVLAVCHLADTALLLLFVLLV